MRAILFAILLASTTSALSADFDSGSYQTTQLSAVTNSLDIDP